jgi:lycopene cyclase domain-containing protein
MNPHFTYLLVDVATIFFPFILSFDRKVAFYKKWKHLLVGMVGTGALFVVWDILFTHVGVWSFNPAYITGYTIANLPLEEWLFFVAVPYACAFVYECWMCYFPFREQDDRGWKVLLPLGILLLLAGLIFYNLAYTFSTFVLCGAAIIVLYLLRKRPYSVRADVFLLTFVISLLPFFIVNGVLTAKPVVIYNPAQNLGLRLYTIPFEDTFYGMLLMLGNIAGMEWARGKRGGWK